MHANLLFVLVAAVLLPGQVQRPEGAFERHHSRAKKPPPSGNWVLHTVFTDDCSY